MPAEPHADTSLDQGADAPRSPRSDPPPDREITLEEWVAAGQACCGADAGG